MTATQANTYPSRHLFATPAPLLPDEIRLQAGGAGWMGTFTVLVRALVDDLLTDGEPFEATIITEPDLPGGVTGVIRGYIDARDEDDDLLLFTDGVTVEIDVIRSITV